MKTNTTVALLLLTAVALTGCKKEKPPTPITPPAGAGKMPAGHPTGQPAAPKGPSVAGEVLETIDAAGYTYIKIKTAAGEKWAAVRKTTLNKGARVAVVNASIMRQFKSKTLNRTFDEIYFGQLGQSPGPPAGGTKQVKAAHGGVGAEKEKLDKAIPKAKGKDARTVAEVFAQKAKLSGKTVVVKGKVVKFNGGIMGRNWIHIQDGTGEQGKGNFDLTATSKAKAAVGDVVTIKGTVAVDKKFGAGYSYAVLVENAEVTTSK